MISIVWQQPPNALEDAKKSTGQLTFLEQLVQQTEARLKNEEEDDKKLKTLLLLVQSIFKNLSTWPMPERSNILPTSFISLHRIATETIPLAEKLVGYAAEKQQRTFRRQKALAIYAKQPVESSYLLKEETVAAIERITTKKSELSYETKDLLKAALWLSHDKELTIQILATAPPKEAFSLWDAFLDRIEQGREPHWWSAYTKPFLKSIAL